MLSALTGLPPGISGLGARGTVIAQDVEQALRLTAPGGRLAVVVDADFDGYMAELAGALKSACAAGTLASAALIVPDGMLAEAREQGDGTGFRVFAAGSRAAALSWLAGG